MAGSAQKMPFPGILRMARLSTPQGWRAEPFSKGIKGKGTSEGWRTWGHSGDR